MPVQWLSLDWRHQFSSRVFLAVYHSSETLESVYFLQMLCVTHLTLLVINKARGIQICWRMKNFQWGYLRTNFTGLKKMEAVGFFSPPLFRVRVKASWPKSILVLSYRLSQSGALQMFQSVKLPKYQVKILLPKLSTHLESSGSLKSTIIVEVYNNSSNSRIPRWKQVSFPNMLLNPHVKSRHSAQRWQIFIDLVSQVCQLLNPVQRKIARLKWKKSNF